MIIYEALGHELTVVSGDEFEFATYQGPTHYHNREQLTELRHIIDQALNTSAEELGE